MEFLDDTGTIDSFWALPEPQDDNVQELEEAEIGLSQQAENQDLQEALSEDTASDEEDAPAVLTPLTLAHTNAISTFEFHFDDFLPEYPPSHPQGATLVLNTRQWEKKNIEYILTDFQYSRKQLHPPKRIYCAFLQTHVQKHKYQCTGVKVCEYLDPRLREMHHEVVNEQSYHRMLQITQNLERFETDIRKRGAISFHSAIQKRFDDGKACAKHSEECKPYLGYYAQAVGCLFLDK